MIELNKIYNEDCEIWKPAVGYEKYLEVSNKGNARRKTYSFIKRNGRWYHVRACNLKLHSTRSGYLLVNAKGGKEESIHRLVALTFIPNPNNYPEVNHIDEDKTNNCVENLEWCTHKYNSTYGSRTQKIRETLLKKNYCGENVSQYTIEGVFIRTFVSFAEARKETGINNIHQCANAKSTHAGGYVWIKSGDTFEQWKERTKQIRTKERHILQFDKNGNFINEYRSALEAERKTGTNNSNIRRCCKGNSKSAGGFLWKYKN